MKIILNEDLNAWQKQIARVGITNYIPQYLLVELIVPALIPASNLLSNSIIAFVIGFGHGQLICFVSLQQMQLQIIFRFFYSVD